MRVSPVAKHSEPEYPVHGVIDQHPELFNMVPRRWQSSPVVIAALTAVCTLMASFRANADDKATPVSRVAPVFMYGEGRGSFGCKAINPPVVLSEAEARQVIEEEAKHAGIVFAEDKKELIAIKLPVSLEMKPSPGSQKEWVADVKTAPRSLFLDGTDTKRDISYEVVTHEDFATWTSPFYISASAWREDVIDYAKTLRKSIADSKAEGTYAVFYDPYIGRGDAYKAAEKRGISGNTGLNWEAIDMQAKEMARTQLRRQVQDFIKWMKNQGVI